jgi:hypothetical protein
VYLFFATGVNNFVKLPVLTQNVNEISNMQSLDGQSVQLKERITILQFMGNDVASNSANAFNLAHKIYKKNYQFEEFQFVTLITEDQKEEANDLKLKISEIENPKNWRFVIASPQQLKILFQSLESTGAMSSDFSSDQVFIIDKEKNLRGREDDEDYGKLYGYDASNYAEINNKMSDDIKVVLAEYRLALKKYKAEREI